MPVSTHHGLFVLETESTAYAFGVNAAGLLTHSYWGVRFPYLQDYPAPASPGAWGPFNNPSHLTPEEYPGYEDLKYTDPCLKCVFADGVRDVSPRFQSFETDGETLHIHLRDPHYPLLITLHYRVIAQYDLIERWTTLTNTGEDPITLERAYSAQWHLPIGDRYRLTHLHGRWFDEAHLDRTALAHGLTVLESRRLTSSHHHYPYFALDDGSAHEEHGEVWFGVLDWSGNWKLTAEVTDFAATRLNIGINDWDFAWRLGAGDSFETPRALAGFTTSGFGAASRLLHRYVRDHILPHPDVPHKVFYNSWEATLFAVDEPSQIVLATRAAELGAELFMIDDGWYKGRVSQASGLGDWTPDDQKFPDGLERLIRHVNTLGMDFGLWLEPEMVNPDSDLYRAHPDWVIHYPTRERRLGRDALHLNLARTDVQDHLIETIDRLLRRYHIRYVKWDMNRNVSEPGWPDAPGDPRELWVRYVTGLYRVWDALREQHPDIIWQSCSGGGGRVDLAMLRYSDLIWISDNSHAAHRLWIQDGFSQMFPAAAMQTWVTDQGADIPLRFRFHAAMCGMLGVGADITRWTAAQLDEARLLIAQYKALLPLIQFGDLYRLHAPDPSGFSACQYLSRDQRAGVLFAFNTGVSQHEPSLTLRVRGLIPDQLYRIDGFDAVRSGAAWMNLDLQFGLYGGLGTFDSTIRRITYQKSAVKPLPLGIGI